MSTQDSRRGWVAAVVLIPALALGGCCATDGSCGFTANGPQPPVAYKRMMARCAPRGGIRDFHQVIANPGARALFGEYDYVCVDGTPGIAPWDWQGPGR